MDRFWSKVMTACVANYEWGSKFNAELSEEKWKKGLSSRVRAMDADEFDLFLASVVMLSAKEQMMGVSLTEKVNYFRSLREN